MYWSDWTLNSNDSGKIERAFMDGSSRKVIITGKLSYPNGLTIDHIGKSIYWCDAFHKQLEGADLNGKNRRVSFFVFSIL